VHEEIRVKKRQLRQRITELEDEVQENIMLREHQSALRRRAERRVRGLEAQLDSSVQTVATYQKLIAEMEAFYEVPVQ